MIAVSGSIDTNPLAVYSRPQKTLWIVDRLYQGNSYNRKSRPPTIMAVQNQNLNQSQNQPDISGYMRKHKRSIFFNVAKVLKKSRVKRTSRLSTPIERLEDHKGEIFSCEFHPGGELLMSSGLRQQIHICSVYGQDGDVMILRDQCGAIMEAHFSSDGSHIYSCASDETLVIWDTFTGIKMAELKGHLGCVNSVQCGRKNLPFLCSGGDDATVRIWDIRQEMSTMLFENGDLVTSICFDATADHMFTGGICPDIKIWDIRLGEIVLLLQGHTDAVSGIALSPCGAYLLSNSLDSTLRIWDIRPTFTGERCIQVIDSNQRIVNGNLLRCAWSPDGTMVSAGLSEESVPVWNVTTGVKVTDLPGHTDTINDVDFHPTDEIIASGSADNYLFLHEIVKGKKRLK